MARIQYRFRIGNSNKVVAVVRLARIADGLRVIPSNDTETLTNPNLVYSLLELTEDVLCRGDSHMQHLELRSRTHHVGGAVSLSVTFTTRYQDCSEHTIHIDPGPAPKDGPKHLDSSLFPISAYEDVQEVLSGTGAAYYAWPTSAAFQEIIPDHPFFKTGFPGDLTRNQCAVPGTLAIPAWWELHHDKAPETWYRGDARPHLQVGPDPVRFGTGEKAGWLVNYEGEVRQKATFPFTSTSKPQPAEPQASEPKALARPPARTLNIDARAGLALAGYALSLFLAPSTAKQKRFPSGTEAKKKLPPR